MTLELMWNIFSGIGEVEDVMLKKTKDKKYGLVKFVNIEDAKKFVVFFVLTIYL